MEKKAEALKPRLTLQLYYQWNMVTALDVVVKTQHIEEGTYKDYHGYHNHEIINAAQGKAWTNSTFMTP